MKSTAISVVATVVLVFTVVGILWGLLGWATLPLAETRGCGEMWLAVCFPKPTPFNSNGCSNMIECNMSGPTFKPVQDPIAALV